MVGLAPSVSSAGTLGTEAGIRSETLQRFLARHGGIAGRRLSGKVEKALSARFQKTVLVGRGIPGLDG